MKKTLHMLAIGGAILCGASEAGAAGAEAPFLSNQSLPFIGNAPQVIVGPAEAASHGRPEAVIAWVTNVPAADLTRQRRSEIFFGASESITNELPILSNAGSSIISSIESGLPMLSNSGASAWRSERSLAPAVESVGYGSRRRIEQLATGAAAAAVVELKCRPADFEHSSREIQREFEARAAGSGDARARSLAKDAAKSKFAALAKSSRGQDCGSLAGLKELAAAEGFGH